MRTKFLSAKTGLLLALLFAFGLFSFVKFQATSITGKVSPADGANKVWAVMGSDSSSAVPTTTGEFAIKVTPGTWKIVVDAKDPYKDVVKDNITVEDGKSVDVGTIDLQK
ncbi:MAG: carboxypeptidase regulatory-like domain-containing protein [Bacteroidetes bacterium]|nr:MAG: carboxypeptidase regulatory-like domain-containing protein [Bacteroidota bacterium]